MSNQTGKVGGPFLAIPTREEMDMTSDRRPRTTYEFGVAEILGSMESGLGWGNPADFHRPATERPGSRVGAPAARSPRSTRVDFRAVASAWRGSFYSGRIALYVSFGSVAAVALGIVIK